MVEQDLEKLLERDHAVTPADFVHIVQQHRGEGELGEKLQNAIEALTDVSGGGLDHLQSPEHPTSRLRLSSHANSLPIPTATPLSGQFDVFCAMIEDSQRGGLLADATDGFARAEMSASARK